MDMTSTRSGLSSSTCRRALATAAAMVALVPFVAPVVEAAPGSYSDGARGGQVAAAGPSTSSTSTPTSSTSSDPTGSTTTVPGATESTTTTVDPSVTTTTYLPPVPPELVDDPRLGYLSDPEPNDGLEVPVAQKTFDLQSVQVLPERVAESKLVVEKTLVEFTTLARSVENRTAGIAMLEERVGQLGTETRVAVRRAAKAREELRDHAVIAYTTTRSDPTLSIIEMTDASDVGVAREYMTIVMRRQNKLMRAYDAARNKLRGDNVALADSLGVETSKLTEDQAMVTKALEALQKAQQQLAAYEAGAHAYSDGFVFPIAADSQFIDSWGFPRMMGTGYAHWHQGTDIFADYGSPVIASEDGVIERFGQAVLGGNKLWIKGQSGISYYYAHLSAFAAGLADGVRVTAGQLVGYVGDTGNAKGTSPHLHFEVHPADSDVVNAYPLLKAAYGSRPVFQTVAPPPVVPVDSTVPIPVSGTGETSGG